MSAIHCFFCGGKECKYENWKLWNKEANGIKNAIDGLYSSWITPNIMAMQRPSQRLMKEYKLIDKFQEAQIGAVFNLQQAGEHASCGDGIRPGGFSYIPEEWMDNGLYYYNFGWPDMDVPDMQTMLDIVQVMTYSMQKVSKIAVHCHAGLGRTGLAIACFLIYSENIKPESAILLVRSKRPGSVQTQKQVVFVKTFESFLKQLRKVYAGIHSRRQRIVIAGDTMSLRTCLNHQMRYLHGGEQKILHDVPKIVYRIAMQLSSKCTDSESVRIAVKSFQNFEGFETLLPKQSTVMYEINDGSWGIISHETDSGFLVGLLLYWVVSLKEPIISKKELDLIDDTVSNYSEKASMIEKSVFQTINYILHYFRTVTVDKSNLKDALFKIAMCLTTYRDELLFKYRHPAPKLKLEPSQLAKEYNALNMQSLKRPEKNVASEGARDIGKDKVPDMHVNVVTDNNGHHDILTLKEETDPNLEVRADMESVQDGPVEDHTAKGEIAANEIDSINGQCDIPIPKREIPELSKLVDFLFYMLDELTCNDGTRAAFRESLQHIHPPAKILHASEFIGTLGFGTNEDLSKCLKVLHPVVKENIPTEGGKELRTTMSFMNMRSLASSGLSMATSGLDKGLSLASSGIDKGLTIASSSIDKGLSIASTGIGQGLTIASDSLDSGLSMFRRRSSADGTALINKKE